MNITSVAFIGHAVANLQASRAFYEGILHLAPPTAIDGTLDSPHGHLEYDLSGTTLAITTAWSDGKKPERPGTGLVLEVDDFPAAIRHLESHHIPIELGPFEGPACSIAVVSDPDGNKIGLHKRKSRIPQNTRPAAN